MAKGIIKNYTFSTGAKTVTLTDIATVRLDKLALITDVTTNKILYNFADATVSTATVSTNVITLSVLQGGESNSDKLRIDYDVESSDTSAFADVTAPVSAASLPLPTSAATSTKQSDGSQKTQVVDGSGNVIGATSNALDVNIKSNAATNQSVNVAQINGVTTLMGNGVTGTGSQRVTIASDNSAIAGVGAAATSGAVPANAVYAGTNAATSLPTAATAGNITGVMADKYGRQVVLPGTIRDLIGTQTTTISASTAETTIVTAAASVFNDLLMLVISNTSASTNTRIDIRDTTAGTILFSLQSIGGAAPIGFSLGGVGIPQTTVNTNWTAQCATSTTDIRVYAVFAKNR